MNRIFLLTLSLVWCTVACGQTSYDKKLESLYNHTVPLISADSLSQRTKADDLIILDTRTPKEYAVSHLPNAILVDYDRFRPKDVKNLNKDAPVIVYCSVGYRSERIGEKMQKMGFKEVKNLYGGIFAWKNSAYSVINSSGAETDSVHTYNKNWSQWLLNGIKVYE